MRRHVDQFGPKIRQWGGELEDGPTAADSFEFGDSPLISLAETGRVGPCSSDGKLKS